MTGDDRLRAELEALERAAPSSELPVVEAARPRPWGRIGLLGATVVAAIAVTSLAFGFGRSLDAGSRSSSPSASGPPANPPAVAETRVGDFILTISSPKTLWTTAEAVDVSASLTYAGSDSAVQIGAGVHPVVFIVKNVGSGETVLSGAQFAICLNHELVRGEPLRQPFVKAGEVAPTGAFDEKFFGDPVLRMPPGEWEFTASASLNCDSESRLEVSIILQVAPPSSPIPSTDAAPKPPDPEPSQTTPVRVCAAGLAYGVLDADEDGNPVLIMGDGMPTVSIVFSYPEDFVIESAPVLTIYDRRGTVLAREGDEVKLGGGFNADDTMFYACGFIQPPARAFDDNATSVTGVLSGDRELEGGCVWLLDSSGARWEVIWPDGYMDGFRDGVPALLKNGTVVASEGDIVTVTGRRPTGLGSRCMVGTLYDATEVEVP